MMATPVSTGVLDKAMELADAISNCEELSTLKIAAENIDSDDAAAAVLREYQEKQAVAKKASAAGLSLPPEHDEELQTLQQRIDSNESIKDFAQAQGNFYDLIERVNEIIAAAIMGRGSSAPEDPDSEGEGHVHGPGCSH